MKLTRNPRNARSLGASVMRNNTGQPHASMEAHESSAASSTLDQVRWLLAGQRGLVAVLAFASLLAGFTEAGILAVLAQSATALATRVTRVHIHLGPVHVNTSLGALLIFGVSLTFIRLALQVVLSVVPSRMVADTQARLRSEVFAAFTQASWSEQSRDREGHLQELVTNQVMNAIQGVVAATTFAITSLAFLVLVASALTLSAVAALIVLVAAAALSAALRPLSNLGGRYSRTVSQQSVGYAGGINEAVRVAEEAHVFGAGAAQRARADQLLAPLTVSFFKANAVVRVIPGIYQGLIYLLVLCALAVLYLTGSAEVASLEAVVLLLVRAGAYGQQAQAAHAALEQALPYVDRLRNAQSRYRASTPTNGDLPLESVHRIAFQDVCFAYERGRRILSDIDFEIARGELIGVVGPSGAGKSTLVQLLLRLQAPDSGEYLINGISADEFGDHDWHERFAYVPQQPRLLHAPVAENIRFFRDLDDATVERAARMAGIHDDVMTWSHGYETVIGPRADAISGGQQQRICVARALAGQPDVLVLDEPTSQLDLHSEAVIQATLAALKHSLTVFLVAHRLSTLTACDRVMVVVQGRLEGFDRIPTLRLANEYYRSITDTLARQP